MLAWSGTDNPSHLNVIFSRDGIDWSNKFTIPNETTPNAVALAFNGGEPLNGRTFIGWTGADGDHSLNVMSTKGATLHKWGNKHTLKERSHHGPTLLFDTDDHLNIMSSGDLGASWQNKRTLGETSPTEPALAFWNGNLVLMWNGTDSNHRLNFIQSSDGGRTWGNKVTLGDTSEHHPAMAIGADDVPYFCWVGVDNDLINLLHSESGNTAGFRASPSYKRTFYDTGVNGPFLCGFKGKMFISWTGTDSNNHVNVAQLSRGAVAVFGHLHRSRRS